MKNSLKRLLVFFLISVLMSIIMFAFVSYAWIENISFKHTSPFSVDDKYVYGVYPTDTWNDINNAAVDSTYLRFRTSNNKAAELTDTTTTGARVQIYKYNKVQVTSYVVIKGDVSGDGLITSTDYTKIKSYLAKGTGLNSAYLAAADTNGDKKVSSADYVRVKKHFAGSYDLFPVRGTYPEILEYNGPYSDVNGAYGGVDDLGREQLYDTESRKNRSDKQVGVFYFLWQGQHGSTKNIYDNTAILKNDPTAYESEEKWLAAGGGDTPVFHFWDKPLLGYYISNDAWVMSKHIQMLTEAGVDYVVFDCTNAYTYNDSALLFFSVLDKYYKLGYDVPEVAYYTNSYSQVTMTNIMNDIYKAHPEYSHLWYMMDGKPMIIGNDSTAELNEYFTVIPSQWPNETLNPNGFPWMEFDRYLTARSLYKIGANQVKTMNVSIAQHHATIQMSAAAWYGGQDRTRSYTGDEYTGLTKEEAMLSGTNYSIGFKYALYCNPDNIFITGFNEWMAQRLNQTESDRPIKFVDCATPDASRDFEPSAGVLKDNYYMQTANFIKQFKGGDYRVDVGENTTIDITGDFSQWDNVTAVYKDYVEETFDRDAVGYGRTEYKDSTGRNDFSVMKMAKDEDNLYFYVETTEDISSSTDVDWMNLFLRSKGSDTNKVTSWKGFDYVINRTSPSDGKMTIEKSNGGWDWTLVGYATYKVEGNKMMIAVSKSSLGLTSTELLDIQFKWADNCGVENDVLNFYSKGDTAPYGRFTYIFSQVDKAGK